MMVWEAEMVRRGTQSATSLAFHAYSASEVVCRPRLPRKVVVFAVSAREACQVKSWRSLSGFSGGGIRFTVLGVVVSGLVCMPRSLLEGACFKETQENNKTMMKEAGST